MALANYTLAHPAPSHPLTTAATPLRLDTLDDLLYSPEDHQGDSAQRPNEPFTQPRRKLRKRAGTAYLPPPNQFAQYSPYMHTHTQLYDNPRLSAEAGSRVQEVNSAYDGTGGYVHDPSGDYDGFAQRRQDIPNDPPAPAPDYPERSFFHTSNPYRAPTTPGYTVKGGYNFKIKSQIPGGGPGIQNVAQSPGDERIIQNVAQGQAGAFSYQTVSNIPGDGHNVQNVAQSSRAEQTFQTVAQGSEGGHNFQGVPNAAQSLGGVPLQRYPPATTQGGAGGGRQPTPSRPAGFTKVEGAGGGSTKTQLHAVLDYDDDEYDDVPGEGGVNVLHQPVTPLQGPILVKNGSVPVVPLFSYPTVSNGSYYQIPILWTALSLALGYELQGQVIRGVPCVKRNYQLYCPTAGNTYPLDKIENFIDENKALMKRMYGAFGSSGGAGGARTRRAPGVPDPHPATGDSYFRHVREGGERAGRSPRQASRTPPPLTPSQGNSSSRVDACESKTEIVTPYWALNSARKLRAVVNTMHFEQAIHQEVCSKTTTSRCSGDCGCEQKYKWHRLLAYDPEEDCSGIFMDWFLFPSCCVCRCNP